jgi:hypothetical protein
MTKFNSDIDIDVASREIALAPFKHYSASILRNDGKLTNHASGVYFTEIPHDHNLRSTLDYKEAEERGYFKVDVLNVSVYEQVKSEEHLVHLMTTEPPWEKLYEQEFCEKLIHIGNYFDVISSLPDVIDSIPRLMMFIAMIRPSKKHLIGKSWSEVAKTIWEKPTDGSYAFKQAHACAYSHLVVVNMNLLNETLPD